MNYRVFCIKPGYVHVVTAFERLESAVHYITTAWHRGDPRASYYCIVDPNEQVIAGADDLLSLEIRESSA